jgi:hypothetical protein
MDGDNPTSRTCDCRHQPGDLIRARVLPPLGRTDLGPFAIAGVCQLRVAMAAGAADPDIDGR